MISISAGGFFNGWYIVCEKMSRMMMDEAHEESGFQVFQPYPAPDHSAVR